MPGIETSSDIYQNRDQGLTTYRKNVQGPALREEMARRTEDRAKTAQVDARQAPASAAAKDRAALAAPQAARAARTGAAVATGAASGAAAATGIAGAAGAGAGHAAAAAPVTPAKVVHELYAPASRNTREHDDRHSMITGGTVDVRA